MLFACVKENCQVINDWLAWSIPEDCRLRLEVRRRRGNGRQRREVLLC